LGSVGKGGFNQACSKHRPADDTQMLVWVGLIFFLGATLLAVTPVFATLGLAVCA
jgi:hypothetical protein